MLTDRQWESQEQTQVKFQSEYNYFIQDSAFENVIMSAILFMPQCVELRADWSSESTHYNSSCCITYVDCITWRHFPYYWAFVRGIYQQTLDWFSSPSPIVLNLDHWLKYWLGTAPVRHQAINCTLGTFSKLQWHFIHNSNIFIQGCAFKTIDAKWQLYTMWWTKNNEIPLFTNHN